MIWSEFIKNEQKKPYYIKLKEFVNDEYEKYTIYPSKQDMFNAFNYTEFEDVRIVILGQDPYHRPNQAHGLSFSVQKGLKIPPSLINIYKEIENEYGISNNHGNLVNWAKQGVLLLNTVLTVRESKPGSHKNRGWEIFTDNVIKHLNNSENNIVFMLWGNYAISKENLITNSNHLVLKAPHPSPLSAYRGFIGCNHFILANKFLEKNNIKIIDWSI